MTNVWKVNLAAVRNMEIKLIKYKQDIQLPKRYHHTDTGADIFMPSDGRIGPRDTAIVKLGFGIVIPNGYTAKTQVRTSIASKGILVETCAIDAEYTGEISLILHNISYDTFTWKKGDRLAYIEVYPIVYPKFVEEFETPRDNNAFGSTGK